MPRKTHEHKHRKHKVQKESQKGFIADTLKRSMNKNEKIIMGLLVGGIVTFLLLSIVVLFGRGGEDTTQDVPTGLTPEQEQARLTPYPTVPPIENMQVMINSRRLNPPEANIPVGGSVSFFNVGGEAITIEAADPQSEFLSNVGTVEGYDEKSIIFNEPGTFTYRVAEYAGHIGVINVR